MGIKRNQWIVLLVLAGIGLVCWWVWFWQKASGPVAGEAEFYKTLSADEQVWLEQHPFITIGMMANWPPLNFVDHRGEPRGIGADYVALLNQRLGGRLQLLPGEWSELYLKVQERQLDALMDMTPKPSREAHFNFTRPYADIPHVIIADTDATQLHSAADLKGKTLALEAGFGNVSYFREHYPEVSLREYSDTARALDAVARGEADAYVGNRSVALYLIGQELMTNLKAHGRVEKQGSVLAFGVREDWPQLVSILDKALASISQQQQNQLIQKWVPQVAQQASAYQWAWRIGLLMLVLLLLVLAWSLRLKYKVLQHSNELQHLALYDGLTDLPNRFLMVDRLAQQIREAQGRGDMLALLFLDLDDFKKINDSLGHHQGDQLLLHTTQRLLKTLGANAELGRLGGDEFLIVMDRVANPEAPGMMAERLLSVFHQPFRLSERESIVTASIGVALYPADAEEAGELLRHAEAAMYHAKHSGRNAYSYFSDALNQQAYRRLELEEKMHGALERGEFEVYYQPKVDIVSNRVEGFEALLRWHNDELGWVSPAEFIPVAEHNGLIQPIGQFVLEQALATLVSIQPYYPQCSMAVNVSPRQFQDPGFLRELTRLLRHTGVRPEQLELEITEGVLMSSAKGVQAVLKGVKDIGISIAMDDFGTGYSSLSNLRNHPFDTIKIDQEFIRQMHFNEADRNLVKATIAMAKSLQLNLVAEGVETGEQRRILRRMGCKTAQGYLFSKPLPASELSSLVLESRSVQAC